MNAMSGLKKSWVASVLMLAPLLAVAADYPDMPLLDRPSHHPDMILLDDTYKSRHQVWVRDTAGFRYVDAKATNDVDILRVQDEVHVTFSDVPIPQQPIDDQVKQDGTITLLFNHTFHVAGKTPREVEKEIHDYYVPNYYRNMTVTVRVLASIQLYYANGEVKMPNRQFYIGPLTLTERMASAGGFTDFARKRSYSYGPDFGSRFSIPRTNVTVVNDPPGGIGLLIGDAGSGPVVKRVVPGTPASKAGVCEGDMIVAIDGQPVTGVELHDVALRLRGEIGSEVEMTVSRPGQTQPIKLKMRREAVVAPSDDFGL
jgi:hypothetical protein